MDWCTLKDTTIHAHPRRNDTKSVVLIAVRFQRQQVPLTSCPLFKNLPTLKAIVFSIRLPKLDFPLANSTSHSQNPRCEPAPLQFTPHCGTNQYVLRYVLPFLILSGPTSVHAMNCNDAVIGTGSALETRNLPSFLKTFSRNAVHEAFGRSERLLFSTDTQPTVGREFYATNELDGLIRGPVDRVPTDVVIGFGTNSSWDIAVRKNAKVLIIADWSWGPLIGQEYLFRPLILSAKTPGEFLGMLAGVPVPESVQMLPLGGVVQYIDSYIHYRGELEKKKPERNRFLNSKITEMAESGRFTRHQLEFVSSFFNALVNRDEERIEEPLHNFGPFSGVYVIHKVEHFYSYFRERYAPQSLWDQGATESLMEDPFLSVFSSSEAFERLQRLFDGSVYYAHASIEHPGIYETAKKLGARRGFADFTISASNIFDCGAKDSAVHAARVGNFLHAVVPILTTDGHPLAFYQTRGMGPRYKYERMSFGDTDSIEPILSAAGYPKNNVRHNERVR